MKNRILVFPCGSEIGLEIFRSLRYAKEVEIFGGSSVDDHGSFIYENYIGDIPRFDTDDFIEKINEVIETKKIDYIFPAHDDVVLRLALAIRQGSLNCKVITSPYETCMICRSKKLTMNLFEKDLRIPRVYRNLSEIKRWPVFLKPEFGQGSKGTAIAHNPNEFKYLLGKDSTLIILEYLPGAEYTVDCFTDRNRRLIFVGGRERIRIQNGISVHTKPVHNLMFKKFATKINDTLELRGMWFFQVKQTIRGDLALMEIAPRIAGGMGLYRNMGINFALMSLYDAEGVDIEVLTNKIPIEMDRALENKFKIGFRFEHVYVDFDDCLVLNNEVNIDMIKFLYYCRNKGIRLHLITRHPQPIIKDLRKYRLQNLFDTIDHLYNNEPKSISIKHASAVFIDDSFTDRKEVKEALGIPVFAPDAVESLLSVVD